MPRIDIDALEDEWDEADDGRPARHPRRTRESYSVRAQERLAEHDVGRVVGVDRGHVLVRFAGETYLARYGGSMRGQKVVVGDRVRVRPPRHETDAARVLDRLARDTVLLRTGDDADDGERVLVANADQAAVVVSADYLDGAVGLLERVLVAASAGGLSALIVINKIDLAASSQLADVDAVVRRYSDAGVASVRTSAVTGEGLGDLADALQGRWTVFAGHSGVGKSSLFNRLVPEAERDVGEIGRFGGRHTTVSSRAMWVADLDAWLVDTPGVRSFGLGAVSPDDLAQHFPELRELGCELDDCRHDGEPGCRVASAAVHPERLASYRRLLAALREGEV